MTLLETVKCADGQLSNLQWHNIRFNQARKEYFGLSTKMNLANFIKVPASSRKGVFKCRISYAKSIEKIEFIRHKNRMIESLKIVEDDLIDYHLKYSDRSRLDELFSKRDGCDDILIVKNGFVTDSWTSNVVFFDGRKWWTSDTPLLPGTQRARLISEGKLSVCRIRQKDLIKYQKVGLINAMNDLQNMPLIEIRNVKS